MRKLRKLCVAIVMVLLCGCGAGGSTDKETVSMYDLNQKMEEAESSLPEMLYASSEDGNPKEVKRIEDGIIFTRGQYAVLIICDHPDAVRKSFEDMIK